MTVDDPEFDLLFISDLLSVALAATILFIAALEPFAPLLTVLSMALAGCAGVSVMARLRNFKVLLR